jgi:hypothetical protein
MRDNLEGVSPVPPLPLSQSVGRLSCNLKGKMKTKPLFTVLVASTIFLASCSPVNLSAPTSAPSFTASSSASDFIEPDPETFVAFMPTVLEYFYYRKQAIITNNIETFWIQYPELKNDVNIEQGINSEKCTVTNYQGLKPFDGNISPEHYERFKVKLTNGQAEVLVHGMELYTWLDENNKFEESGGEFKIILYLHMKDGRWVMYKTDEVTIGEWQQFSP